MLKQSETDKQKKRNNAAAFGQLCVETTWKIELLDKGEAAAFGRLCVETFNSRSFDTT